jgi:hypothetical protein
MNEYLKERELWWPISPELMAQYNDGSHTHKFVYGELAWWKNFKLHRDGDKPARIWTDGTLIWYKNGEVHREDDKPAVIFADGRLCWYKNGVYHQTTGPAVIRPNNKHEHEYWINGDNVTKDVKIWLESRKYKYPFTPEQIVEFTLTFS